MKIQSVLDKEFLSYGRIIKSIDTKELSLALDETHLPKENTIYEPLDEKLMELDIVKIFQDNIYGGMPIQLGYCNGYNTKLNCLEYHKDSEINYSNEDFILLLAKKEEIVNGKLDTKKVKAFLVPKNTLIEVYSTTLHYAPCQTNINKGFKVLVILPLGTNTNKPNIEIYDEEDKYLFAKNKWLLAHKDSLEAINQAYVGLEGENIDIKDIIK